MQSVDFTEAQRFLALLGKPPGTIRLRAFYHAKNPKKAGDPGRKGGPSRSAIEQWQAEGAQEITARALAHAKKLLREYEEPRLDRATDEALRDYMARRTREIPAEDALNTEY